MSKTVARKENFYKLAQQRSGLLHLPQFLFQQSNEFPHSQSWWQWCKGVEGSCTFIENKEVLAYILYSAPNNPPTIII